MIYDEYKLVKSLYYIFYNIFIIKSYRYILYIFLVLVISLVVSLNGALVYDKHEEVIYLKFFIITRKINCSEINTFSYASISGDLFIFNKFRKCILFCPKIYHKKQILRLFNELKQKYPYIELI